LDAVCRPTKLVPVSPPRAQVHGEAEAGRHRPGRRRRKRSQSRPQLVHGLPARPVDARIPVRQCLGRRRRVSAPNTDGWWPRRGTKQLLQTRRIPAEFHDKYFNFLSYLHRVATCGCHNVACAATASATSPRTASGQSILQHYRRRVAASHDTPLVAATHWPPNTRPATAH
jgi:hypothetical protein